MAFYVLTDYWKASTVKSHLMIYNNKTFRDLTFEQS